MEFEQTFRQCTIIQAGSFEQCGYHSFIIAFFHQPGDILPGNASASCIEIVIKSKILDTGKECLFKLGCRFVIISRKELE